MTSDEPVCETCGRPGTKIFPAEPCCAEFAFAFNFPTCWNGNLGMDNGDRDHMAYTVDGTVRGACPPGFPTSPCSNPAFQWFCEKRARRVQSFHRMTSFMPTFRMAGNLVNCRTLSMTVSLMLVTIPFTIVLVAIAINFCLPIQNWPAKFVLLLWNNLL